ncbi:coth-domain-containing protein, partial [Backusella circina FSU 941]
IGLIFAATAVSAANITYNVISLATGTQSMAVVIDSKTYPLSIGDDQATLLYSGDAPKASDGYSYALMDNDAIVYQENFTRSPVNEDTVNEFFNRSWNTWELDNLPVILPNLPIMDRIDSDLHIDGQIPTIHIIGNQTQLDSMHANSTSDIDVSVNMTYMSLNDVKSFTDATISISGHSTRNLAKLSYNLKIAKKQDLYDYRRIKLRSIATDPSYMREMIAYDMYNSIGMPTSKFSYIRVFLNNEAVGLFGLAEVFKNPWIQNEFANGDSDYKQGALFVADVSGGGQNMTMGGNSTQGGPLSQSSGGGMDSMGSADLSYLGDNVTLYEDGSYKVKEDPSKGSANFTRIMDLARFIDNAPNTTTTNDDVALWQEKMDTDSFLRGIAMEIIISDSDGYFTMANNYILYDDLDNERLVFSGQDFDLALGHSINNATLMNDGNYSNFPNFDTRPLMPKMLKVPQFKEDFENLMLNITKELMNNNTLSTRIDQLAKMIATDVEWDKSCTRLGSSDSSSSGGGMGGGSMTSNLPFNTAVYGPTNETSLLGLKEWISLRSTNILNFFNATE